MRILVSNDDGIHAPGLSISEAIAREISDDVWVVAPETDQSGVAHSLSLNDPLRLREIDLKRYAVRGTPTDCVIMAIRHIMDVKPDLVISGVNRGQNVAEDVTYSGTVAAAMEGTILGVASIALSQAYGGTGSGMLHWECGRVHAPKIVRRILTAGIPANVLVNINFPNCEPEQVKGINVAVQGQRKQELLRIEERHDGRGNPYYWVAFGRGQSEPGYGTDLKALANKCISITPLRLDLTDEPTITRYAQVFDTWD
ncbi:MAG: 5'/3'-nucleotidase SurE [Hyphomicrobiales bacterium]